jgi:pimeloyl-ACP methyl ester carboxylesterase
VKAFREKTPGRPVHLIGKSGGTGVIVRALEGLTDDSVDGVVLIAPALSPDYDLTRALRAVRHEAVVFWSPLDVIVLGAGTRIFGTIDRKKGVSAGLVGFRPPRATGDEQRAQYAKLRQVRWRPAMAPTGYLGGHIGPDSPAFLRKYVVPLLRAAETPAG